MGMPVILEVVDAHVTKEMFDEVFAYFVHIDETFSVYKSTSEISRINRGELLLEEASEEMKTVFALAEETKQITQGYFDIKKPDGSYDPSGLVKGWAIDHGAQLLRSKGLQDFFVHIAGDMQFSGKNPEGNKWSVGIQNPFNTLQESVKTVYLSQEGIATSGSYVRGDHIYNPLDHYENMHEIVSLTVIGPNVYEADRFATAAYAMGKEGINFIERLSGFEGYLIDANGIATMTSGFTNYTSASYARTY